MTIEKEEKKTSFLFKLFVFICGMFILMLFIGKYVEDHATPEQKARWAAEKIEREQQRKIKEKQKAKQKRIKAQKAFKTRCNQGTMPFVMVQNAVKSRLKSPSSAKFPVLESKTVQYKSEVKGDTNCYYTVLGVVHAQNSFGAMLKTGFMSRITYFYKTKQWRVTFVELQS